MKKTEKSTFTPTEVFVAVNNVVATARRQNSEIPEARVARLRAFAEALLAPMDSFLEEELLRPEEAVYVCLAAGLLLQAKWLTKRTSIPAVEL